MKKLANILKGMLGVLTCTALFIGGMVISQPQQAEAAGLTVAQLQSKYPNNAYWNHVGGSNNPDKYTWTPCKCKSHNYSGSGVCSCNSFSGAIQCKGFAFKLGFDMFGSSPRKWSTTHNLNSLKQGDVVVYKNGGHTIFVTGVLGNTVTFGECWGDSGCRIKWNSKIAKSSLASTLSCVYVAPGSNPTPVSKMTLTGAIYPTTLQKGKAYPVKGTITSPSKMTYVSAAVYNSAGKWMTGGSCNPNSTTYNLAGLDNKVIYNILSPGTYTYAVYAKNSSGQVCLLSKQFTVSSGYKAPYVSGANWPTSIKCGKFFGLKGMVYGNGSNLRQVTAAVYTTGGAWKTGKTINVNCGSVNIAKSLDPYVVFNHLPRGTYYYKVIAKNSAGTYTLVNKQFKVY